MGFLLDVKMCFGIYRDARTVGRDGTLRYEPQKLTLEQMQTFAELSSIEDLKQTVQEIAIERVPGSPGHFYVREYISNRLSLLGWKVEFDIFTEKVPILGSVTFHNIIARHNPDAKRTLMLGCHYESKYFKEFNFKGATDSAVSCALLLNMAKMLHNEIQRNEISLMFVFFDGEEAFHKWSKKDSLYGSRHLANVWEKQGFLDHIDLFLLLDLIGAKDLSFNSNIPKTENWFQRLVQLEDQMIQTGILKTNRSIFKFMTGSDVQDDHIPFTQRQVPVIHLIATDYPAFWHLPEDVELNVDYNTTEQVGQVLKMFIMEYLLSAPRSKSPYVSLRSSGSDPLKIYISLLLAIFGLILVLLYRKSKMLRK
nr:glutaminyl-peptide cyclotransferase [Drosophila bipectinata]